MMEDSGIDSEGKISINFLDLDQTKVDCDGILESDDDDSSLEVIFRRPGKTEEPQKTKQSSNHLSSCKVLQRKLEIKVERAKRNYNQLQEENSKKLTSSTLIPINRLDIPGSIENQPLVDYKTDSDDPEDLSFFPAKNKAKKIELTDTFSIQEVPIDTESDDSDSKLELDLPILSSKFMERLFKCFYCIQGTP